MSLTRGNIIDRVVRILGDTSTDFRTYLETCVDQMLFALWDRHDWNFKHKTGTFNTVSGTESYNLASTSTDIRSSQDVEVLYDTTNGRFLSKVDLHDIRKRFPKEDTSGQPIVYAPWGATTIFLSDEPNGIFTMKYLYISVPTLPTSDSHDLFTQCGLPAHTQYLFEKMVLAEGMLDYDDDRRNAMLQEINSLWLPNAIQADMRHLESNARFKFWEEELAPSGGSYDDFLRYTWLQAGSSF